jgi:uncharacterized protein YkwD
MPRLPALLLALALASCAGNQQPAQPSFYRDLTQPSEKLDEAAAASMISDYRKKNGLPAVILDPALTDLARAKAQAMARRDKLDRGSKKPFVQRLRKAGYRAKRAGENVGAGYHTLAEAFSGWRDSKPHNANMLMPGASRMGIAAVYTPSSKYKVYWTLILAEPEGGKS